MVTVLAIGIGASTAIFSVINVLILRPLPVHEPHRLVELRWRYPGDPRINPYSTQAYDHYRTHSTAFAGLIGVSLFGFESRGAGAMLAPDVTRGEYVTGKSAS